MSRPEGIYSRIIGTGSYLPERVLTNKELEEMVETSDEWIFTRTGIRERRLAADDQAASDLCAEAAKEALDMAGCRAAELDMIIVATFTPDHLIPSTACILQHALGAHRASAMDLEAACTGFIYALAVADQFIRTGVNKKILVMGAEVLSRWVDWEDRGTCILFGDGAGAAVLTPDTRPGIMTTQLFSDGSQADSLIIPAGGSRMPITQEIMEKGLHYIKMAGNEIFKVAVRGMVQAAEAALEATGLKGEDVTLMIPHQANLRIIEATAKKVDIPMEKVVVNIEFCGNTSAGTIPIALDEAIRGGRIKNDDIILLDAFGAGFTWGSAIIKW
jgi:3-oxoacyl-[acyl-carrier-protein] synthase-3